MVETTAELVEGVEMEAAVPAEAMAAAMMVAKGMVALPAEATVEALVLLAGTDKILGFQRHAFSPPPWYSYSPNHDSFSAMGSK